MQLSVTGIGFATTLEYTNQQIDGPTLEVPGNEGETCPR